MLHRKHRLQKTKEIERILRAGPGVKAGRLLLKSAGNNSGDIRFAFIVSKKVAKKATLRNRFRRALSEAVRAEIPGLKKGIDAVLIVLPGFDPENSPDLAKLVKGLFLKAELFA